MATSPSTEVIVVGAVAWATEESDAFDAVRSALAEWCGQPATVAH
ncbi:hypothetical protein [Tenggerimyces flavus]|uniref:Uncharacterized protein n=1 Tax=Tenggerimyces flavus TaxID=1708749 RepID=A0ABV7YR83_9ACTN|nr:hypothetical protein [Tenggerimyces flavus]MBM7786282.1 hypothetical protein [Tenggerimyces flavus]